MQKDQRGRRQEGPKECQPRTKGAAPAPQNAANQARHECDAIHQQWRDDHPGHEGSAQEHVEFLAGQMRLARQARQLRNENDDARAHQIHERAIFALTEGQKSRDHTARTDIGRGDIVRDGHELAPVPLQPAFQLLDQRVAQALILNLFDRFGQKGQRQKIGGNLRRNTARAQIKQRFLIDGPGRATMRTDHVIGVDLKLGLGQKLAVIVQEQGLADLVAIGLLRARLDQDLALKHAHGPVAQHLLEHLTAFAAQRIMGDEHGVIVMKVTVANTGPSHMSDGIVARQLDHAIIAGEPPVHGQRKAFEGAFGAQTGKDMGRSMAFMIPALRPHMVEGCRISHVNFHHLVEPRGSRAGFQHGQFRARIQLDHVVQNRLGGLRAVVINQIDGARRFARHVDQDAVARKRGVERAQGAGNRRLAVLFQLTIKRTGPMDVGAGVGEPVNAHMLHRQIVRGFGVKHPVIEHNAQGVDVGKDQGVATDQHLGRRCLHLGERIRARKLPILIAPVRQAHRTDPRQRIGARRLGPPALRHRQRGNPSLGRAHFLCWGRHYATSARMSAYPLFSTSSASSGPPVLTIRPSAMMWTTSGLMWSSRR
mmetsp:Transcript_18144/g.28189  ORF Transcript_18144/g.28189 Transcript_18144/m.28189 type:complete len:595 (-) Transcript_18144:429-2213(-)